MEVKKISDFVWELPKTGKMNVPARIYASEKILSKMKIDETLHQASHVAMLPGIKKYSYVMPDGHQGYGFPIGGVAALDYKEGGLSPGGIGFDINCGVRLIKTNLTTKDIEGKVQKIIDNIFQNVPCGVGIGGQVKLSNSQLDGVLSQGVGWCLENGYAWKGDSDHCEENGCLKPNDPSEVSPRAKNRGSGQLGSLGAGNHFIELGYISKIENPNVAKSFGINKEGQVVICVHSGSRGLGHQVCSDYIRLLGDKFGNMDLPDRELIYAPSGSEEADKYFKAMASAANFAWANRQVMTHFIRKSFSEVMRKSPEELEMDLIYDLTHNIAKIENHGGKVYVHRKGATRSLPKNHENVPSKYRSVGQPVILPGNMGTGTWLLVGGPKSLEMSFGTAPHGAGRNLSRTAAKKQFKGEQIKEALLKKGIYLKAKSWKVAAEEAPGAYKDLDEVAKVAHNLDLANYVARIKPVGVIKG